MKRIVIMVGGALVVLLVILIIYQAVTFRLLSTSPANHTKNFPIYNAVVFNFNHKLAPVGSGTNQLTINPDVSGKVSIAGKVAQFIPDSPLDNGRDYTVTMSGITDTGGRHLPNITIVFTAVSVPFNQLDQATQNRYINKQDANFESQTPVNKLQNSLPHNTAQYSLTYISYNNSFSVQVNTADIQGDEAAALEYIKSFGVDPNSINLSYSVPAVYSGHPGP